MVERMDGNAQLDVPMSRDSMYAIKREAEASQFKRTCRESGSSNISDAGSALNVR
jgi:hypothetical protein